MDGGGNLVEGKTKGSCENGMSGAEHEEGEQ